jgi:transcriptional regulator with XRE-family HTH domain
MFGFERRHDAAREKLRELRRRKGVSQKEMASALGVSAAYLSALEHGRRGAPTWTLIQKIIGYFNVIWDDAEELARLAETSHPRVKLDTSGLSPAATELANVLAENIEKLDEAELRRITASIRAALGRR